jgi:AcrR family transcriptional regulator
MTSPRSGRNEAARPARVSKAERKRQLLAHGKQLLAALGYAGTTLEQVAAAAGVSEAALARHFDGKQALFREVVEEVRGATLRRWQAETADLTDPFAKLHAITDLYLAGTQTHALEFRILHRTLVEAADEEVVALVRDFYLECEAVLAPVIAEGQQSGVFRRSLDPRVGAWELIRTALGYTLTFPLGVPLYAEPDYLPRAVECLLHGLLKTDV